jgi:hypothetical protein
MIVANG